MLRLISAVLLCTSSAQALAQDAAAEDARAKALAAQTAAYTALAARDNAAAAAQNASAARVKAKLDALGIAPAEGKATIGTNGGMMESWMLSASALQGAADWIASDVRRLDSAQGSNTAPQAGAPQPGTSSQPTPAASNGASPSAAPAIRRKFLLLSGDEALDLDMSGELRSVIDTQSSALRAALPARCSAQPSGTGGTKTGGVIPLAAIGAFAGLLKSDTEVSGTDVAITNRMLAAAVARKLEGVGDVVLPAAAIAPAKESELLAKWNELLQLRDAAKACQAAAPKKKIPALDAAVAAVDALETKQTTPDSEGHVPLMRAVRQDKMLEGDPSVLRVYIEKAAAAPSSDRMCSPLSAFLRSG